MAQLRASTRPPSNGTVLSSCFLTSISKVLMFPLIRVKQDKSTSLTDRPFPQFPCKPQPESAPGRRQWAHPDPTVALHPPHHPRTRRSVPSLWTFPKSMGLALLSRPRHPASTPSVHRRPPILSFLPDLHGFLRQAQPLPFFAISPIIFYPWGRSFPQLLCCPPRT